MELKHYKLKYESPQYFGSIKKIKHTLTQCPECGAKLIYHHIPNHKDMTLKEVIKCAVCEQKPTHQFFKIQ